MASAPPAKTVLQKDNNGTEMAIAAGKLVQVVAPAG
jgi:hypothetical protein